jgi:hypothetical protein
MRQEKRFLSASLEQANNSLSVINLKGLILGNPVTDWSVDGKTSYVGMGHYYGLYGTDLLDRLRVNGCRFRYLNVNQSYENST